MEIHTIGFTKKDAEEFFGLLEEEGIEKLIDVRLRNWSQLSGFAKRDDLDYFLRQILDADYEHLPILAPNEELLDAWRDDQISWRTYENRFFDLMAEREVENELTPEMFEPNTVLLCSEHKPDQCHRRLVVEYLDQNWGNVDAIHLM